MYFEEEQIPRQFPATQRGKLERIWYESGTFDGSSQVLEKDAIVYLPWGYGQNPDQRYPVLYLMHGGGGNADDMFGGLEARRPLKDIVDHAIETGRARPMILVTPSYNIKGHTEAFSDIHEAVKLTHRFPEEMTRDLIPLIDQKYRTIPDRWSRAFGGFSMGAETTWSVMAGCLDEVAEFVPMSGDYWACGEKSGKTQTQQTVDALIRRIRSSRTAAGDYQIYAFTGTEDIAFEAMDPMIHEMEKRPAWFNPGENLHYYLKPGAHHDMESCMEYLSMALPMLFHH